MVFLFFIDHMCICFMVLKFVFANHCFMAKLIALAATLRLAFSNIIMVDAPFFHSAHKVVMTIRLLRRNVIKAKYEEEDHWMTKEIATPYGVNVWRSIRALWEEFKVNTKIKVANGAKTDFWKDEWHEIGRLERQFPDIYEPVSHQQKTIADFCTPQGCPFNFSRQLNDWEIQRVADFFRIVDQFTGSEICKNKLWWKDSKKGQFKVSKAYSRLNKTSLCIRNWPWKSIWKNKAPHEVACFVWLLAKDADLTQDNLVKRGIQFCPRCFFSGENTETVNHLFLHCKVIGQFWRMFLNLKGILDNTGEDYRNNTELVGRKQVYWQRTVIDGGLSQHVSGSDEIFLLLGTGLAHHDNYHEFCRLLGRFKVNYQLSELVNVESYRDWIRLVAEFTLRSLQSWQWASSSVYYLLGLWSRLVSSVPYLKGDTPSLLSEFVPEIVKSFITSRFGSLQGEVSDLSENPLDNVELLQDQLDCLPYLCRFQYDSCSSYVMQITDPLLQIYMESADPQVLTMVETKFAWIVHIIAAIVKTKQLSGYNGESQEIHDAELSARVLQLINVTDSGLRSQRYAETSKQRLDLAILVFFQNFRKSYVGDQAIHSSKVHY
ncbi:hypothetical protein FXO38_04290 [Capsicum annuum]|nr:hypothetical protein FXO38_04290 [Capsicum annuum]KAF3683182.1 hypothetical protein FXO37_01990 [Capsicum annuum]